MVRSFVAAVRVEFVRVVSSIHSVRFWQLKFTLTVHINALCNESVHRKEEHAT